MSTDAMSHESDSPWRRLVWTLPAALSIGITALWFLAYFTEKSSVRLPEPPAVDAQLIEIPAPTINAPVETKKRVTPAPRPVTPVKVKPQATPLLATSQLSINKHPSPSPAQTPVAEPRPEPAPSKSIASPAREEQSNSLAGNSGAQAIVKPMPHIPDELRQDALTASALARFHVAIDGTATIELIRPTPNPKLNRLLLDTLKNWRFFPSMKDGKPVVSTQEIVIKIEVK